MTQFNPSRFQILPTIIKNLLIINGLVFLAQVTLEGSASINIDLSKTFALHTWQSSLFRPWQLVTHMFMHGSFDHLVSNMFALWMFGSILENVWGPKKFLTFYMICGLGAALCHMLVLYYEMEPVVKYFKSLPYEQQQQIVDSPYFVLNGATLGASGAVFGCLAAFGYLFPNSYISIIPIKTKWLVLIYGVGELMAGIRNSAGDNVAHFAHLGGAVAGFILVYYWNKTNRKTFY